MSAWHGERGSLGHRAAPLALAVYFGSALGLVGTILWRLWKDVLGPIVNLG
jgi:hypothetical protein